jgi:hypothetical protein
MKTLLLIEEDEKTSSLVITSLSGKLVVPKSSAPMTDKEWLPTEQFVDKAFEEILEYLVSKGWA